MSELSQAQSFPIRISVMTFNCWGSKFWPERAESLAQLLSCTRTDIILLQEVTPDILSLVERTLANYDRVVDDTRHGWNKECNIFWNRDLFTLCEHGAKPLEIKDYIYRDLAWVRLALKFKPEKKLFFSTAHFPWSGCESEIDSGVNQRIQATHKVCSYLRKLVQPDEPAIFGGDFNDDFHPIRLLNENAGFMDVFESLDLSPPITHPVRPSDPMEETRPNRTLDWITCSLPYSCRVIGAYVKTIRGGSFPPPSDHLPVLAFFEIC